MAGLKMGVISLGCSKNRVDTEMMLGYLQVRDIEFTEDPSLADVILINTCGFIESAKQESIDTILEMAEYKKTGSLKALLVAGCLSGRYKDELAKELPEVDAFLGVNAYDDIAQALDSVLAGKKYACYGAPKADGDYLSRVLTTPSYTAYVKVAEGCNNRCSYCAIPYIRGNLQSRTVDDIEREVIALLARGVREIVLVAQDTTRYGWDLKDGTDLPMLLERLAPLPGLMWLRVLYCYPESITPRLLEVMAAHDNIVKYLDIPIQHLDDSVLKRMNRKNRFATTVDTVKAIRAAHPDFVIRTTLITGFPGETEEAFERLKKGVEELEFDRLGAFAYSQEDGTPAAEFEDQLPEELRSQRRDAIMAVQQPIALAKNKARIGKTYTVLVEGQDETGLYIGRSYAEAPEIDGNILISADRMLTPGVFYPVVIRQADEYDLMGEMV
ncbi:MAG: 30S ribosomal protein S12 methylthiotransferase RimO [Christensenellaceae bacterium]|nr:30S ribosomal protein S12 methylthiotransferase RimO [Christensenellaceae bacterium]